MGDFEIRTTGSRNEWSSWCREKTGNILQHLAEMSDAITRLPAGPEREALEASHYAAVWDALKMVAFSTGHHLTGEDLDTWRRELCAYGSMSYSLIAKAIGLPVRTPHAERNENLREAIAEATVCLNLPRGEGRTRLHAALLRASAEGGAIINSLLERIELVTMGEVPWEVFVSEARPLLEELKRLNGID